MVVYSIVIILVTFFSGLIDYSRKKKIKDTKNKLISRYFMFLTSLVLILVAGLRWRVGSDYRTYAESYSVYLQSWWDSIINFNEPGIKIISALSSILYDDYATMFFIASFVTIGLSVLTLYKYSDYFSMSILLYIFSGAWHGSFNVVRQYLAIAVLFAGHRYIIERKFWRYLLVVFFASMFHLSALTMIVLYFVPRRQLKIKEMILLGLIVIGGLLSYDLAIEIINTILVSSGRYPLSMNYDYLNRQVNFLRVGVMIAPPLLYIGITPKKKLNSEDNFYINMLFVNAAIYLMTMNSAYLGRFFLYTNIYLALGFPKIFKGVDKKLSLLIIYISFILYGMFWGYEILITNVLRNFQWIFER